MGFVLDASVLIHFARADAWALLEEATGGDFVVPAGVLAETSLGTGPDAQQIRHRVGQRIVQVAPADVDDDGLGPGEREVLAAGLDGRVAVLDDRRGRAWAKAMDIEVTGTVGLLLRLRGSPGVGEAFDRMLERGMRLDASLALRISQALAKP